MNEVINTQMATPLVIRAASSKGAANTQAVNQQVASSGNQLPAVEEKPVSQLAESTEIAREKVEAAVASINDFVQSVQRDLRFSVDEELNRTVIKVVDSESGELIRQIPEEIFLELARKLKDDGELQLVSALG